MSDDTRARAREVVAGALWGEQYGVTLTQLPEHSVAAMGTKADADAVLAALEEAGLVVEDAELVEKLLDACGEANHHIAVLEDISNNPPDLSAEDRDQLAIDYCSAWETRSECSKPKVIAWHRPGIAAITERWHITRRAGR